MTLDANEKVYQSDMQHITPVSDAAIYGYDGDWILQGLGITIGDSSVTLHAGKAILQGRLYELTSDKVISTSGLTGTIYIGLRADLSLTNTETSNNQFTLEATTDAPAGDLLTGDIQAFIGLYSLTGTAVTKLVLNYDYVQVVTVNSPNLNSGVTPPTIQFKRHGRQVHAQFSFGANLFETITGNSFTILNSGALSLEFVGKNVGSSNSGSINAGMTPLWYESVARFVRISNDGTVTFGSLINRNGIISATNTLSTGTVAYGSFSYMIDN